MGFIAFIILGLLAGLIAKAIMPGTLVDTSSRRLSESPVLCSAACSPELSSVRTRLMSSSTSQRG